METVEPITGRLHRGVGLVVGAEALAFDFEIEKAGGTCAAGAEACRVMLSKNAETCLDQVSVALCRTVKSGLLQRITIEPGKCGGRPCIRGKRLRVTDVLELLSARASSEEILTIPFWNATTFWPRLNTLPPHLPCLQLTQFFSLPRERFFGTGRSQGST